MTSASLGIKSVSDVLEDSDEVAGIELEDVEEIMQAENGEEFATSFDQAINSIADYRSKFGSLENRLHVAKNYVDVYEENVVAAKSKFSEVNYPEEMMNLVGSRIRKATAENLFAQSLGSSETILKLLNHIPR